MFEGDGVGNRYGRSAGFGYAAGGSDNEDMGGISGGGGDRGYRMTAYDPELDDEVTDDNYYD
jgi:hypothetical protein